MSGEKKHTREKISIEVPLNGCVQFSKEQINLKKPLFVVKLSDEVPKTNNELNEIDEEQMPFQASSTHPDIKSCKDGKGLGQNIAYHIGGKYIAFVKGTSKNSENNDHCKVVVTTLALEGIQYFTMKGAVQDLSFAHDFNYGMLGAIDEFGSVVVKLCVANSGSSSNGHGDNRKSEEKLKLSTWLFVDNQCSNPKPMHFHRLVWIPFIEHENATDSERYIDANKRHRISRILGITDGRTTEIWSVDEICTEYFNLDQGHGKLRKLERSEIKKGRIQTRDCDAGRSPVVDLRISPCGEMLCTLDAFGEIRFYFLRDNLVEGSHLKSIKQFSTTSLDLSGCYPPAFSFFTFIDDYSKEISEKLVWKCIIVGFDGNTILKVYDCQNWKELQRFDLDLNASSLGPYKAIVDPSGQCLILSSTSCNVMLVLKLGNLYTVRHGDNGLEEVFLQGIKSIYQLKVPKSYEYGAVTSVTEKIFDKSDNSITRDNEMDIRFLGFSVDGIDACKINLKMEALEKPVNPEKTEERNEKCVDKVNYIEARPSFENTKKWVENVDNICKSKAVLPTEYKYCSSVKGFDMEKPISVKSKSPVVDKVTRLKPSTPENEKSFSPVDSIELFKAKYETSAHVKSTIQIPENTRILEDILENTLPDANINASNQLSKKSNDANLINLDYMTPVEPRPASTCNDPDTKMFTEINSHLTKHGCPTMGVYSALPTVYQMLNPGRNIDHNKIVSGKAVDAYPSLNNPISSHEKTSNHDSDEDIIVEKVELIDSMAANETGVNMQKSKLRQEGPYASTPEKCATPEKYDNFVVEKLQKELQQIKTDMNQYQLNVQKEIDQTLSNKIDEYSKTTKEELKQFIREESIDAYCSEKASINNTIRSSQAYSKQKNILAGFPAVAIDMERIENLILEKKIEEALSMAVSTKYPALVMDVCKKIDLIQILKMPFRMPKRYQVSRNTLHEVLCCLTAINSPAMVEETIKQLVISLLNILTDESC